MGQTTGIEWTDATWSPIRARVKPNAAEIAEAKGYSSLIQIAQKMAGHVGPHCEHVSPGCENCYSDTNNGRCLPANGTGLPFDRRSRDLVEIFVDEKILAQPLKWREPQKIFPCNQTDWAADFVTDEMMDRTFALAILAPQHTFQFLTKRADRLVQWFTRSNFRERILAAAFRDHNQRRDFEALWERAISSTEWRPPNIQLGFSAEDQPKFDARWEHMRKLAREGWTVWCSYEPALGPVNFLDALETWRDHGEVLSWIVVGGESGRGARPFDLQWARDTIVQGKDAGVPVFTKQLGAFPCEYHEVGTGKGGSHRPLKLKNRKGGDIEEWPADLHVREFPSAIPAHR